MILELIRYDSKRIDFEKNIKAHIIFLLKFYVIVCE